MQEWLTPLLMQMGGGAIAGMAVGFAFKKTTRLALLALGLCLILLYVLMQHGFITVKWDAVSDGIETGARALGQWVWAMTRALSASLVGFTGGFMLGLKIG
jgi:uncharacterized membrane protein (Fun14 family)